MKRFSAKPVDGKVQVSQVELMARFLELCTSYPRDGMGAEEYVKSFLEEDKVVHLVLAEELSGIALRYFVECAGGKLD